MEPKARYVTEPRDDLAWEENDKQDEIWEKSLYSKEVQRAVGNLILRYRPGAAEVLHRPIKGGYNVLWRLEYKDGSSTALRVPFKGSVKFPDEKTRYEAATMRYIAENTTIPVPKVYHYGIAAENPIGIGPFIIMEYIEHEMTMSEALADPLDPDEYHVLDPNVSEHKLNLLYGQMANILLQLSRLKFPRIGSLVEHVDGTISVSGRPLTQNMNSLIQLTDMPPTLLPSPSQTYTNVDEWYTALADMHMAQLVFQHNDAVEDEDDARDKYVARQLFRQLASSGRLTSEDELEGDGKDSAGFLIYSSDLRPSNILIDKDLQVVGIIDWEFAYVAPALFAFDPPWWLLLRLPECFDGKYKAWMKAYKPRLETFLRLLEVEEEKMQASPELVSSFRHLALSDAKSPPLSKMMRQRWESKAWMINYAAKSSWEFDALFWRYLDPEYFGPNEVADHQARLSSLTSKESETMDALVKTKMDEAKERSLVHWDHGSAKAHLARFIA
ncbi:phosphotransferase family protein [Astrocystis sublimbata]|nr:phosphotransferase family protein [Astrocystis sublimbata]